MKSSLIHFFIIWQLAQLHIIVDSRIGSMYPVDIDGMILLDISPSITG
jgi:hypothetical protein